MRRRTKRDYAKYTKVPVSRSKVEMEETVKRFGAESFAVLDTKDAAVIVFEIENRRVRFSLNKPPLSDMATLREREKQEREMKRLWRCLVVCVKAKLVAVEDGIASFDEEFLPYLVLPDGQTVSEKIVPQIEKAHEEGRLPALMSGVV